MSLVIGFIKSFIQAFHETRVVVRRALGSLFKDPQILAYPYLAITFILFTSPFVTGAVLSIWNSLNQPTVITEVGQRAPDVVLAKIGLVGFSIFYAAFVTSYFICATSAATSAKLEGRSTPPLYGLRQVLRHFLRVSWFAFLAIFFFPLGIIAQWRKLRSPRGILETIGSSFSLNIAQLAPAILGEKKSVLDTVRHSINTLGRAWRENLIIKGGMYLTLLLLAAISFLPKLIENLWFDGGSAEFVGWLLTALLGATSYVAVKVIGAVFTTTLYYETKNKK